MAKYNVKKTPVTVKSNEGAPVFKLKDELALISILSTGIDKTFYEKADEREKRLVELINTIAKKDPMLVAQMLVYARQKLGQRTVTHRGTVALAPYLSGKKWAKLFYSKRDKRENKGGIVYRLDDILEIASCYFHLNPDPTKVKYGVKNMPNSMKKGFRSALENADAYELAKYQAANKGLSLHDMFNLLSPKPSEKNAKAFHDLIAGELKQFNTVEDKNTEAGQVVAAKVKTGELSKTEAAEELKDMKASNFAELIKERKIGYLALLRNLRNILKADDSLIKAAGEMLTDVKLIKQSLVYPHQIDLAIEVIADEFKASGRKLLPYIDKAYELSTANVKELGFDEHTAVVVDTSGSMFSIWNGGLSINGKKNINRYPIEKASLIAATLAKGVGADLYQFSDYTKEIRYNVLDSVGTTKNLILHTQGQVGHGTNFDSIFNTLGYYKRIFIITDGQTATSTLTSTSAYKKYVQMHGQPYIYYIDLVGYGTAPLNMQNDHIHFLTGYSAQIYETAKAYEVDPDALLAEIRAIKF